MLTPDQKEALEHIQCATHALGREPTKDHPFLTQLLQMMMPILIAWLSGMFKIPIPPIPPPKV
jgi:hypothetical protein